MTTLSWSRRLLGPVLLIFSLAGLGAAATATSTAASTATAGAAKPAHEVYFVAGVGFRVEVSLDGESIRSLAPKSVAGPVDVAAGSHQVEFRSASWTVTAEITLDRPSSDVVVHRPADVTGDPIITVFTNDLRPIAANRARLTVAHTAVVPPADVRVAGKVLFANIANGEFVTAEVPADTYSVDIVPTGESTPLFGPIDLTVTPGALNRVFAVGRPENGSMDAVVQVIELRTTTDASPSSVHAGSAGLVAPSGSSGSPPGDPWPAYVLLALGALTSTTLLIRVRIRDRSA